MMSATLWKATSLQGKYKHVKSEMVSTKYLLTVLNCLPVGVVPLQTDGDSDLQTDVGRGGEVEGEGGGVDINHLLGVELDVPGVCPAHDSARPPHHYREGEVRDQGSPCLLEADIERMSFIIAL